MMRALPFTAALVWAMPSLWSPVIAQVQPADTILTNGKVYLVEPKGTWAEALAIDDGKIVAVGTSAEVKRYAGSDTRVIDLDGRMAMPGLIDAHLHLGAAAADLMVYKCEISNYASLADVLEAVRKCAVGKGPDDWVVGQHWGSGLIEQLANSENLKLLDEAGGGRPVMLRSESIHDRWVNRRALSIAGIDGNTPDPINGKIGKDSKTGQLNGLLLESAGQLVERHIPGLSSPPGFVELVDGLEGGVKFLNSKGVTGFNDASVVLDATKETKRTRADLRAYRALDRRGLTANATVSILIDPNITDISRTFAGLKAADSDKLSTQFAKIFVDGVQVARTGYFLEPYLPDHEHGANFRGEPKMTPEKLNQAVVELDRLGISVKMHVSGDAAIRMALDAVEQARRINGDKGPLHTLAHAGFITDQDMPRAKRLRAAIDASPVVWIPGPPITATAMAIGEKRTEKFFGFKTYLRNDLLVTGGSDWKTLPGEFSDMWDGMEGMVTRRNPRGAAPGAFAPSEAIGVDDMIAIYTINSAKALGLQDRAGSLKVGKDADIVVLDRNLFTIPASDIARTQVDLTFFRGKEVYARKQ